MMQASAKGYRGLVVWQRADALAQAVFRAVGGSRTIPRWLVDQVCRSAVSVPANIAEGHARNSLGDYLRFLEIARGSLAETDYYIHFLHQTQLIDEAAVDNLAGLVTETRKLLFMLVLGLNKKREDGSWHRSQGVHEDQASYNWETDEQ